MPTTYADDPRYLEIMRCFEQLQLTGHPRFYQLLALEAVTHADKNHDYAGTSDPLANLRACAAYGIDPIDGLVTRITDKDMRFQTWYRQRRDPDALKVKDESMLDTLTDRSVYTKLLRILLEEVP